METFEEMEARHMRERAEMVRRIISTAYLNGKHNRPASALVNVDQSFDEIVLSVCRKYRLTQCDIFSNIRVKMISEPRQELMYLCHEAGMSQSEIGRKLNRDPTTILHGIESHKKRNGLLYGDRTQ